MIQYSFSLKQEVGGMMALTDAYCRVNRARGLELVSPDDLLNACRQLAPLNLPIILRIFDSGVMVLQARVHSDYEVAEAVSLLVCINLLEMEKVF